MDKSCQRYRLSNGLEVLAIPSRNAPVVALQGWIRFGSADEGEKQAGLAHLFEHLLFKGTQKRKVGEIAREVESLGGDLNAYTTYDHTVMHLTFASKHLHQGLDILADSLMNSTVDEDELTRERVVVLEEIKRRNDMPGAIAGDLLREKLFTGHPYGRPVIGYAPIVANMSREEILTSYKRYYNTENLFLVISGDFESEELAQICEHHFAGMKKGSGPETRPELRALSDFEVNIKHNASPDALLHLGWQGPTAFHEDAPAMDALALILGQGESSRLVRKLVLDEKLLRDIGAYVWGPKERGSFQVGMKGQAGTSKVYPKILAGIEECLSRPFTESELEKAKKNLLASSTYSKETVDGLAQRFGYFESVAHDWEGDSRYLEGVKHLSLESLENARRNYLSWEHVVAAGIVPEKDALPTFAKPTVKKNLSPSTKAAVKKTHGVEAFEYRGLKVLIKTLPQLPIFSLRWTGLGGARIEPSTLAGIGSLWSRSVASGARANDGKIWTRNEINEKVDRLSASLSSFHGKNSFGHQADGLSDDFDELFSLLSAIKSEPLFVKEEVELERSHQLLDLKSSEDSPGTVVNRLFAEKLFGKHPYGRASIGTVASIKKIKAKDLLAFHKKGEAQAQILSIVGDISRERVEAALERYWNKKTFTKHKKLKALPMNFPTKKIEVRKFLKKEQTHILIGYPTTSMFGKDRWPLLGLAAVLSGQGGRLFMELRDKMSLCYTVAPTHMEGLDGGYFGFYIATSPEKEMIAREALQREIDRVIESGIPEEEWNKARTFYSGNFEIEQQRLAAQAMGMNLDELYGLGFAEYYEFESHLKKVTAADLKRVAQKYFKGAPLVTAVVGPK